MLGWVRALHGPVVLVPASMAVAARPYPAGMQDERLLETTVERRDIYTGHYLTFRVDTIVDAHGLRHSRELVDHPGAVAILALDRASC